MRLTLTIDLDNTAFDDGMDTATPTREGDEIARILRNAAADIAGTSVQAGDSDNLRDHNGNKVGKWTVSA